VSTDFGEFKMPDNPEKPLEKTPVNKAQETLPDWAHQSGAYKPDTTIAGKQSDTRASDFAHESSGVELGPQPVKLSDKAAITATTAYLFKGEGTAADRVTALNRLSASGVTEIVDPNGQKYKIETSKEKDGVKMSLVRHDAKGAKTVIEGTVDGQNNVSNARSEIGPPPEVDGGRRKNNETPGDTAPHRGDRTSHTGEPSPLFDPKLTLEDKLKAADKMAHEGKKFVVGPDGKRYDISSESTGNKNEVSVFTRGSDGKDHVVIRGLIDKHGNVTEERDRKGHQVGIQGGWFSQHDSDNPILKKDAGDRPPLPPPGPETTAQRLERDAKEKMTDAGSKAFIADMRSFEERAQRENLPAEEVSKTYDQMSKLLEANEAKVSAENRVLAAQGLMSHLANPETIYQGQHNTCNVSTLEVRDSTKHPSTMASIMTDVAISGAWTATDGKRIALDDRSLVPGAEERTFPPQDGDRTFATQLLNNALVNDVSQRRVPPEIYWQETPSFPHDTGERRRYVDTGETIMKTDAAGNRVPWASPHMFSEEISQEQTRLAGDQKVVIENSVYASYDKLNELVRVSSIDELSAALRQMKQEGKFPAVIAVDCNHPAFGGDGTKPGQGHVVSISDYDPVTQQVRIVNQWGHNYNKWMPAKDVYEATYWPGPPRS
jgi:hypothetical protein